MEEKFVKVPMSIITSDLLPESRVLLCLFVNHVFLNGPDKPIKQPVTWYANYLHLSDKTIRTGLSELTEKGFLVKKKGIPNSYRVNFVSSDMANVSPYTANVLPYRENVSPNTSNVLPDTANILSDMANSYIYKNTYKNTFKNTHKKREEEAHAHTREAPRYDEDLFRKRKVCD